MVAGLLGCQLPGGDQGGQCRVAVAGVEVAAGEVDVVVRYPVGGDACELAYRPGPANCLGAVAELDSDADRPDRDVGAVDRHPVVVGVGGQMPGGAGCLGEVGARRVGVSRAAGGGEC